ncbi:phosphatidylinositol N-acetylglucosaminyltransferase subunit Q-like isoform X2 [Lineus longissimus]
MNSLKVFIPHNLLLTPSGWLLAWQDNPTGTLCTLATIQSTGDKRDRTLQQLITLFQDKYPNLTILGLWKNDYDSSGCHLNTNNVQLEQWITLHRKDSDLPLCELKGNWPASLKPTAIIFDSRQVLHSCPLMSKMSEMSDNPSNIKIILKALTSFSAVCQNLPDTYKRCIKTFGGESHSVCDADELDLIIHSCLPPDPYPLQQSDMSDAGMIPSVMSCALILTSIWKRLPGFFQNVFSMLMVWEQLKLRCHQVNKALFDKGGTPRGLLRRKNSLYRFLFDMACGVLLMAVLLQHDLTRLIAKSLMDWAEVVGDELSLLLKWLMGVPAGLKLNSHLDQLLGSFFLYHIYLWKGYLTILQPVFDKLLWYGALSGCLGLSMQLSLMSDLLSMLTLHIYCFYAYAAKLYSLQIQTLASLWRLFRGKKQNPLRKRVDSTSYDVDQLFIGTLLFTILLFLLPTTGVYYIAFTMLRLVVIIINGCLGWMVSFINTLPVYSLIARGLHLAEMAGDLRFSIWPHHEGRPLYLSLQVIQCPLSEVYHLYKESDGPVQENTASYTWGEFGKNLIIGKLVYPWVSVRQDNE